MTHLIIGNGIAGVSAAEAIRELDSDTPIVMVSDEDTVPYSRPMISQVLDGSQAAERLPIRSADFYEKLNITPLLGKRVSHLDVTKRQVVLEDGFTQAFDRLLVASGADARVLRVEGADLHALFSTLHIHPDLKVTAQADGVLVSGPEGPFVRILARGETHIDIQKGWYCAEFNCQQPCFKLTQTVETGLPAEFGWEIQVL